MNRTSISVVATLAALAAAAPANAADGHSDTRLALQYSAEASVALQGAPRLAGSHPGERAQRRLGLALSTAHQLEAKAASASARSLSRGRQSTRAAISGAAVVISRLDAAGRTEAAVVRSSTTDRIQEQAAAGVELNAELTSSLNAQLAGITATGDANASISASGAVARRSPRVVRLVRSMLRTLPSAGSAEARAQLDSALAVVISGNRAIESKLADARDRADDRRRDAASAAVDATQHANAQIKSLIDASGAADHEVSAGQNHSANANANADAGATVTLGEIAASSTVAANTAVAAGGKR